MQLDPKKLNLPLDASSLPSLRFDGNEVGVDSQTQAPLVLWEVDQPINQYIPGLDVTIHDIKGTFTTALLPLDPIVGSMCDGSSRVFGVILETVGTQNTIAATGHKSDALGIDHGFTLTMADFEMKGLGGDPAALKVDVHVHQNNCGTAVVEGAVVRLSAWVKGIPAGANALIKWTTAGGQPIGPDDQQAFKVKVPSPPQAVQVSATVTAAGITAVNQVVLNPLPKYTADLIDRVCEIRMMVFRNFPWDPLWDPWRDRPFLPITKNEWRAVSLAAHKLLDLAGKLGNLAEEAMRSQPKQ